MATTSFMGLPLSVVNGTLSPLWAQNLNQAETQIDSHTHVFGQGQQIPSAGIGINAPLTFATNNATDLLAVGFTPTAGSPAILNAIGFGSDGNLYARDGSNNLIQITVGGAINPGSNNYAVPPLVWDSNTVLKNKQTTGNGNKYGLFYTGPISFFDSTAVAPIFAVTVKALAGLGANVSIQLPSTDPAASPGSLVLRTLSGVSGVESYANPDASTIEISGSTLQVKNLGITTAKLANSTGASDGVTNAKIATSAVTGTTTSTGAAAAGKIALGTISGDGGGAGTGNLAINTIVQGNVKALTSANFTIQANWTTNTTLGYYVDVCGFVHFFGPVIWSAGGTNPALKFPLALAPVSNRHFAIPLDIDARHYYCVVGNDATNGIVNIYVSGGTTAPSNADEFFLDGVTFMPGV